MKATVIFLAASVWVVFSSPPGNLQEDTAVKKARAFYYYQQTSPTHFYDQIPLVNYYPFYSHPYMQIENKTPLNVDVNARASVTTETAASTAAPLPSPLIDENVDDDEAMKQLETLKNIYAQNSENGIVLPSIISSSRGLLLIKNAAFISFLNNISLTSFEKTKTKVFIYPTTTAKTKTKTYLFPTFG